MTKEKGRDMLSFIEELEDLDMIKYGYFDRLQADLFPLTHRALEEDITKVNPLVAALGVTKDLLKDLSYNFVHGSLPTQIQKKIAEERGENAFSYSKANIVLEPLILASVSLGAFNFSYTMHGSIFAVLPGISLFSSFLRHIAVSIAGKPVGSIYLSLPYHSYKWISNLFANSIDGLKKRYKHKKKELGPKVRIETRIKEIPQLLSPTEEQAQVLIENERA